MVSRSSKLGWSALTQIPAWHGSMKELLRTELETELRRLMGVWFPRSVDREHGGFLCDFDHRWRPGGSQLKMLEYQARQTIAAARAAAHLPDFPDLREAAAHGFRYLKDRMWDPSLGGWYRLLDRIGEPLEDRKSTRLNSSPEWISYAVFCLKT